jgi:hypothetical protein
MRSDHERNCTVCLPSGKRVRARFVARAADGLEWYECGEHAATENVAGVLRVALTPIGAWFHANGLPCPNHAEDAACLDCQDGDTTDGAGFPHPGNCKPRTPLRECEKCSAFVPREQWRRELVAPHREGCSTCLSRGHLAGAVPAKAAPGKSTAGGSRVTEAIALWVMTVAGILVGARLATEVSECAARVRRVADWIAAIAAVTLAVWVATQ